ncbi:unnamed protein product [Protopolystoma xenopodis]|uniref:Uncharacterized protein n=1 Tax=Protopolystoma xenopodis TaxID=117903 RepID=A0A3S5CV92_9PLAT|nr:unnamed protein product [Protopolystoma xenopodis]
MDEPANQIEATTIFRGSPERRGGQFGNHCPTRPSEELILICWIVRSTEYQTGGPFGEFRSPESTAASSDATSRGLSQRRLHLARPVRSWRCSASGRLGPDGRQSALEHRQPEPAHPDPTWPPLVPETNRWLRRQIGQSCSDEHRQAFACLCTFVCGAVSTRARAVIGQLALIDLALFETGLDQHRLCWIS